MKSLPLRRLVRSVSKINIRCAGFVSLDECGRARPRESVAGFVDFCQIRVVFHWSVCRYCSPI